MGWPDGSIPHGHIDVMAQGTEDNRQETESLVLSQVDRLCFLGEKIADADIILLREEDDDFDNGDVFAEVIGGEEEALLNNPVGKQFVCP